MVCLGTRCHLPETSSSSLPIASSLATQVPGCITCLYNFRSGKHPLVPVFCFSLCFYLSYKLSHPELPGIPPLLHQKVNSLALASSVLRTAPALVTLQHSLHTVRGRTLKAPDGEAHRETRFLQYTHKHLSIVSLRKQYSHFLCSCSLSLKKKCRNTEKHALHDSSSKAVDMVVSTGVRVALLQGPGGRSPWGVTDPCEHPVKQVE